jgi:hypothetical protein
MPESKFGFGRSATPKKRSKRGVFTTTPNARFRPSTTSRQLSSCRPRRERLSCGRAPRPRPLGWNFPATIGSDERRRSAAHFLRRHETTLDGSSKFELK